MNASFLKPFDEEIIRRYKNGESSRTIGRFLNSCETSVDYRLKINGIKKRSISQSLIGRPKPKEQI